MLLALHNVQPPNFQIYIAYSKLSGLSRTQTAAIHQLYHSRDHILPYRETASRFQMVENIPNCQDVVLGIDVRSVRSIFPGNIRRQNVGGLTVAIQVSGKLAHRHHAVAEGIVALCILFRSPSQAKLLGQKVFFRKMRHAKAVKVPQEARGFQITKPQCVFLRDKVLDSGSKAALKGVRHFSPPPFCGRAGATHTASVLAHQ